MNRSMPGLPVISTGLMYRKMVGKREGNFGLETNSCNLRIMNPKAIKKDIYEHCAWYRVQQVSNLRIKNIVKESNNFLCLNPTHHGPLLTSRLSSLMVVCVCALLLQLFLTRCFPMDCSLEGSSVHGIFQARMLEWPAISFFRGSSPPRDRTHISYVSCIGSWVLYH